MLFSIYAIKKEQKKQKITVFKHTKAWDVHVNAVYSNLESINSIIIDTQHFRRNFFIFPLSTQQSGRQSQNFSNICIFRQKKNENP